TSSNTSRANQDNSPRINKSVGYENQRSGNVAGARENVDAADSGPIFDDEPLQKVSNNDHYNVFAMESVHPEQSKPILDTYPIEQDALNVIIDSLDMSDDKEEISLECQKPKQAKDAGYHREKMLLCKQEEAGIQLNAEQADWKDDTDDESDDQELEAHYMYMAKVQEVSSYAVDSGPIFDTEPEQKVQNDDHYDVFAIECQHPEQSESVYKTYLTKQDAQNVINASVDMNYDNEQIDQNDEDTDLAKEHFKNKNNNLELSNNQFKEANNKLSKENDLLYADFKKSQAELKRRNSTAYASEMELECAK
nr:hypothetical protein [Tanacetum cinerariifolium]